MSIMPLIRPLFSAIQKTITSLSNRFITTKPQRSTAVYEVTVNGGLEEVACEEVRRKIHVEPTVHQGRVIFATDSPVQDLLKLRSVNNIFLMMYDETLKDEDIPTDPESLESFLFKIGDRCDWRTGLEKWLEMSNFDCDIDSLMTNDSSLTERQPKFRISSNRYGPDHKFTSPELCSVFGHVVNTKFGWPVKLKGMDLDIYINFNLNRVFVNVTMSPDCLAYRNVQKVGLTTLKANICYALLKKANIQTGEIVVDPMAGSGAIPLECCSNFISGEISAMVIGGELRKNTIRKCCRNARSFEEMRKSRPPSDYVRLDVTRLPFCDDSIDAIVSDLPFGHRHGSKEINAVLYPPMFREMGRVARLTTGRAVLLTHDYKNMIAAYQANKDIWTEISDDRIKVGLLSCHIYLYQRTSTPIKAG